MSQRSAHVLTTIALALSGCHCAEQTLTSHARQHTCEAVEAAESCLPRIATCNFGETSFAAPTEPRKNLNDVEYWDLSLSDCVRLAVTQSRIIRTARNGSRDAVLLSPETLTTVYDQPIQRSGVLFGQRGQDAALAEYDPLLQFDAIWGADENVQNNPFDAGGLAQGGILDEDTAQVSVSLSRRLPAGGSLQWIQSFNYDANNAPSRLFSSAHRTNGQVIFRQPLLAGAGIEFNSIAGPLDGGVRGVTGVSQGITIARIDEAISEEEFRNAVSTLVRDVEVSYWRLHQAFEQLARLKGQLVTSNRILQTMETRARRGERGAASIDIAGVREIVLSIEARIHEATFNLLNFESELRKLMSISPNGAILRPCDLPPAVELDYDWQYSVSSALRERSELVIQKQKLRSLDCQICAARNVMQPSLDFVTSYTANGFGDDLLGPGGQGNRGSALGRQFAAGETGWNIGFQFEKQLGLRTARAQLTNLQFQRARAAAILKAQEQEVVDELTRSLREVQRTWASVVNFRERHDLAKQQLAARRVLYEANAEGYSERVLLDAEVQTANAREALDAAVTAYRIAVAEWNLVSCNSLGENGIRVDSQFPPASYQTGHTRVDRGGPLE